MYILGVNMYILGANTFLVLYFRC